MHDPDQTSDAALREAQRQAYIDAIKRAEEEARLDPPRFRRKVVLFAMFGYFFLFVPLFVLLAVTVGLCWVEWRYDVFDGWAVVGALFTGFLTLGWFRSLWVRMPAPEGVKVRRADAPGLFEVIDAIRAEVALPRLSGVYLAAHANAGLYTRPMILGLFGPGRHTLVLGAILLAGLSPEQARALLSHEFSHQRKDDASATTWGFRVRAAWMGLAERGNILVNPIVNWFAPRLEAMTFASAREAEYDADAFAASMTTPQAAGEVLLRLTLVGQFYEAIVVPGMQESIGREPNPPSDFYSGVIGRVRAGEADTEGRRFLVRALRDQTGYEDTHPSLVDRLRSIGYPLGPAETDPAAMPAPMQPPYNALEQLFTPQFAEQALQRFDQSFVAELAPLWSARHAIVAKSNAALGGQGAAAAQAVAKDQVAGCTDVDALAESATMIAETRGPLEAMPWIERILELDADHAFANSAVAKELLDADDPSGVAFAERALASDPRRFVVVANPLYTYYRGQGMVQEADRLAVRLNEIEQQLNLAAQERVSLASPKRLEPHDLTGPQVARLREDLAAHPRLLKAHLFKMNKLKHLPEVPGYVLAVKYKPRRLVLSEQGDFNKLAEHISETLRTEHWVVVYSTRLSAWLRKPCRKNPAAEIFSR